MQIPYQREEMEREDKGAIGRESKVMERTCRDKKRQRDGEEKGYKPPKNMYRKEDKSRRERGLKRKKKTCTAKKKKKKAKGAKGKQNTHKPRREHEETKRETGERVTKRRETLLPLMGE